MSNQIEILKKRLTLGSLPESAKARIQAQIDQLEAESKGAEESATKQQEKLEKEENKAEADVDDNIEKLKKRLTLGSLPEKAKERIRQQIEDAEKLKSEAKKERAEEKKEAEKKEAEVKAKVKEAVEKVKKVVKEAPKKVSAEKTPAKAKAVEKKVEKEVKKEIEKAKTEVKKAKVEGKKVEAKKAEGAKKRKKKFDKMLTDLQRLINKDKKLKALYGADNPSDLKRDAGRMAKPFGWRYKGEHNYKVPPKSERGNDNTYYEGRPEKADLRRRTYPYLEMGGDVMARGGEVSEIKMYYHQTSGGAEYLCSQKVEGTKGEGSFKSKYVVRLDGATNGSKMIIKDNDKVKNIKMYYHETSGGAEYLCSEKVEGTKGEGSFKSKYVVRLDGATDGSEMIIKSGKFADGGMMADGVYPISDERKPIIKEGYILLVKDTEQEAKDYISKYPDLYYEKYNDKWAIKKSFADGGMMANGGEIREGKFQAMFYTNEDDGYHIDSEYFDVYPSESDIEYLAKSLNSKYVEIYEDRHNDDSYTFLEETYFIDEEYKLGGMFGKSRYNTGRSWHLDRARHNKREDYEIPMPNRKGAKKVSSSKSSAASKSAPKRAKTGKYAKAPKSSASASSSSRGYNYIPNSQIKSITTVDDKVITKKKILDGAYVRKKNGGMM
jgi:chemotaxis protein histidine kinase CheA